MSLIAMGWAFTLGALAHNAEEAALLPAWSQRAGPIYRPVSPVVFRCAAVWLSLGFIVVTTVASFSAPGSPGAYLMAGYVLAMALNAVMPHLAVTVITRRYMPGTATAMLLNLPLGALYLHGAVTSQAISLPTFYWAGPLVALGIVALLPGLFALGRRLHPEAV